MIEKETVFILGAGASVPFDFPSGRKLLIDIYEGLSYGDQALERDLKAFGCPPKELRAFANDLYLSNQPSVDAFLENRPEYLEIGKAAIAASLIPCETKDGIRRKPELNWYEYLFTRIGTTLDDFNSSKISFITFNYDRSLEYSLLGALMHSHRLNKTDAAEILTQKEIIHVYGQLGQPDYADDDGRPYTNEVNRDSMIKCVNGIRIFTEETQDRDAFEKAHSLIKTALFICFVGFGYHQFNMDRLKVYELRGSQPSVFGTCYGLEAAEISRVKSKIPTRGVKIFGLGAEKTLRFLRSYCTFL